MSLHYRLAYLVSMHRHGECLSGREVERTVNLLFGLSLIADGEAPCDLHEVIQIYKA